MFEKFTEKAVNVITIAQDKALELGHDCVYPEHLLYGIIVQKSCLSAKLLSFSGIKSEVLLSDIQILLDEKRCVRKGNIINFSENLKKLLQQAFDVAKELNNPYILVEHLFLMLLNDTTSNVRLILSELNFDISKNKLTILKFLDKKQKKECVHPETLLNSENVKQYSSFYSSIIDLSLKKLLNNATGYLKKSNYEILGTDQILQAILGSLQNSDFTQILEQEKLSKNDLEDLLRETNRDAEFLGSSVVLTPSAYQVVSSAIELAKEFGAVNVQAEHLLLSILKNKTGVAYEVLKSKISNLENLENQILKPIEKQKTETLVILKLAKQEARRLGKNMVGSEMLLLGILGEGVGIGAEVLKELGLTIKDTRNEIERLIGFGNEYNDSQIFFTPRAKKILEIAWDLAKQSNNNKICSQHLLDAITFSQDSVAMKVLSNLGIDVIEIKQGIVKFLSVEN